MGTPELVGAVTGAGGMGMVATAMVPPTTRTTGAVEAMAMYAGESVAAVHGVEPAGRVMRELAEGAEALLDAVAHA